MINVAVISAQSTTVVPNLSGLTASEALAALSTAELLVGTTSTTTSGASSANTGTVYSQSVSSGTVVERYSSVGYTTYYYESAPPPPPPTTYNCIAWLQYTNSPGAEYTSSTNESTSGCGQTNINCLAAPNHPTTPSAPTTCGGGGGGGGGGGTPTCTPFFANSSCYQNSDCSSDTSGC